MSNNPHSEEWNYQCLMLIQALVGAVSANFRMVALLWSDDEWVLRFYLEESISEDIEEIEEVVCQYTAYQTSRLRCRTELVVGRDDLPNLSAVGRIVYRQRGSVGN